MQTFPQNSTSCPVVTGVWGSGVFALVDFDFFLIFLLVLTDFLFRDDFDRFIFFLVPSSVVSDVIDLRRSLNLSVLFPDDVPITPLSGGGDVEMAVDPEYSECVRAADFLCR